MHHCIILYSFSEVICIASVNYLCFPVDQPFFFGVEFQDGIGVIPAKGILNPPSASVRVGTTATVKWGTARYDVTILAIGESHKY